MLGISTRKLLTEVRTRAHGLEHGLRRLILEMAERLEILDQVDAVPVVRCAECKHWKKCQSSLIGEVMCCTGQGSALIQKGAADFCSSGERREGNG